MPCPTRSRATRARAWSPRSIRAQPTTPISSSATSSPTVRTLGRRLQRLVRDVVDPSPGHSRSGFQRFSRPAHSGQEVRLHHLPVLPRPGLRGRHVRRLVSHLPRRWTNRLLDLPRRDRRPCIARATPRRRAARQGLSVQRVSRRPQGLQRCRPHLPGRRLARSIAGGSDVRSDSTAAHTPGGGTRAGRLPTIAATQTCSNVYCHGAHPRRQRRHQHPPDLERAGDRAGRLRKLPRTATQPRRTLTTCVSCHPSVVDGATKDHRARQAHRRSGRIRRSRRRLHRLPRRRGGASAATRSRRGETSPAAVGVGAHQAHLAAPSHLRGPVACTECHRVPETVSSAGHFSGHQTADPIDGRRSVPRRSDGRRAGVDGRRRAALGPRDRDLFRRLLPRRRRDAGGRHHAPRSTTRRSGRRPAASPAASPATGCRRRSRRTCPP